MVVKLILLLFFFFFEHDTILVYMVTTSGRQDQPSLWSALKRENDCFSCPRARLNFSLAKLGSAVPSRVSPLTLSGSYSQDPPAFPRRRLTMPSSQSRSYRVTQLHADVANSLDSAGTGSALVKVVGVTGAAFSCLTIEQFSCASLYSLKHYLNW